MPRQEPCGTPIFGLSKSKGIDIDILPISCGRDKQTKGNAYAKIKFGSSRNHESTVK